MSFPGRCAPRRNVGGFDQVIARHGQFNTVSACQYNVGGGPIETVQGPFLIDVATVFNAGGAGVTVATNTSGVNRLITFADSQVVTDLTGTVPTGVINYLTTSGGAVVGSLAAGMSAFNTGDEILAPNYQRQLTPTHRKTQDASSVVTEINVWEPGEHVVAVYSGGGDFTGGTFNVWFVSQSPAQSHV